MTDEAMHFCRKAAFLAGVHHLLKADRLEGKACNSMPSESFQPATPSKP
jgi:hypothetical protein